MNILKDRIYVKDSDDVVYPETSYDQIVAEDSANSGVLYISPGNKTSVATLRGMTTFYCVTVALYGTQNTLKFKAYFQLFLPKEEITKLVQLSGQYLVLEIYNILNRKRFTSQNHYVSVPASGNIWYTTGGDHAIFSISVDGNNNFLFECARLTDQLPFNKYNASVDCKYDSYVLDTNISTVQ